MLFNSLQFAVFYALAFTAIALLRKRVAARNVVLLVAGYYFYGCWDWRFLGLLVFSTLVDYLCGRLLDRPEWEQEGAWPAGSGDRPPGAGLGRGSGGGGPVAVLDYARPSALVRHRKLVLVASIGVNLGLLGFFKYYNFFVTSAADLLGRLGVHPNLLTLKIVLPVGLSFYTFQSMAYVMDVYWGKIRPQRNLLTYAAFVAFFPQLVAGPIERASHLLPQIASPNRLSWDKFYSGFYLIAWGLFKKVVFADNVAKVANAAFAVSDPSASTAMAGVYAFAIQIYCDFSGYSDIARGAARCMGFDLMQNFNIPYFATNPSDFWRRWHISLSTWLRDYLYIPLGGNRCSTPRIYFNLMATMVLGGLWHGAAWTYVLWGVFHGGLLCIHRICQPWLQRWFNPTGAITSRIWHVARVVIFFHLVCFSWLLFRAQSVSKVGDVVAAMLHHGKDTVMNRQNQLTLFSCAAVLALVQFVQYRRNDTEAVLKMSLPVRTLIYAAAILGFILFGEYGGESFIYFQF